MDLIVFTDLDGSLLNEADYSYEEARPALAQLETTGALLVIATSKTRAEVEALRAELGNDAPFIVENGGGLFVPAHRTDITGGEEVPGADLRVVTVGRPYAELRAFLTEAAGRWPLRGFGDMDDAEVAERCGLPLPAAALARRREFSEPFVCDDPEAIAALTETARAAGLDVTRGGRFHHLIGAGQSKGRALETLLAALPDSPEGRRTVALGDSENDRSMLAAADVAVVIPRPDGRRLDLAHPGRIDAPAPGARGWGLAVTGLLAQGQG
ncbi:MAG: HAD-IIB family hydrolase [Planctomycetota bacterium]|nr:HAD-IIB family hydrolase [Planctomycetota bacterium]